jgi:HNH endonuclease
MASYPDIPCVVPVDGGPCGLPSAVKKRQMCSRHYDAWRKGYDPSALAMQDDRLPWPENLLGRLVVMPNGCVLHDSTPNDQGYCRVTTPTGRERAHRAMWEFMVGPIPEGMTVEHACHTEDPSCQEGTNCLHRRCVNIAHLELMPLGENISRQHHRNAAKTHCKWGHEFTPENTYVTKSGGRQCITCRRKTDRNRRGRRKDDGR